MSKGPENYAGKLTQTEIDHIMSLETPELISSYMHTLELQAGLRVRDSMAPEILHEIDRSQLTAAAPLTVKVAGQTFTGTQEEIDAAMIAFFRQQPPTTADTAAPARDTSGRFARTEPQPTRNPSLDPIVDNLVVQALADTGISVEDLRETVAEKAAARNEINSWAQAVEIFKQGPGADWPGGEELKDKLGYRLAELGLADKPSVESLMTAWRSIQAEADQYVALRDAKTPEEIKTILGTRAREEARIRQGRSY